jgi:hypothetical protein
MVLPSVDFANASCRSWAAAVWRDNFFDKFFKARFLHSNK